MAKLNKQTSKKTRMAKWIVYQCTIALVGTSLTVGYVYTPAGGWQHKWTSLWNTFKQTAANRSISLPKQNTAVNKSPQSPEAQQSVYHSSKPSYTIQAVLHPEEHLIQANASIQIPNLNDSHIQFYLFTEDQHPIQIQSISVNQKPVHFTATASNLKIDLPQRLPQATVQISFQTPVLQGGFRYGEKDNVWTIGYWYPIVGVRNTQGQWLNPPTPLGFGDPFLEDNADYDIIWTAPANYKWFTTGSLLTAKQVDSKEVSEWRISNVKNFALVGSSSFVDHPYSMNTGTVVHVVTLAGHDQHLSQLNEIVSKATNLYTNQFGLYYYPELSVIEMPSGTVFAHEYPGLALFSTDIWQWPTGEHWIAHEIAHEWWYHSVGDYESITEWLDEGLAEYSSLLYMEDRYGKAAYQQQTKNLWHLWLNQLSYLPDSQGTALQAINTKIDQPYDSFSSAPEYYYTTYLRTTLMYVDLRDKMGDQKFFDWLQQFYLKNAGHVATRESLTEAMQDVAPADVPILNQWLDRPNSQWVQQERKEHPQY